MTDRTLQTDLKELTSKLTQVQDKLIRDKSLEAEANELFERNLLALKKYNPPLYEFYLDYDSSDIRATFSKSGHLNMVEPVSGLPIYNDNPPENAMQRVNEFLTKAACSTLSFANQDDGRGYLHFQMQNDLVDLRNSWMGKYPPLVKAPKDIPSLVIAGVGLGYHLLPLLNEVQPNYLYIYEPEPAVFYAALHAIDWTEVFERIEQSPTTMFIDVGSEPAEFSLNYSQRVIRDGRYNASKTYYFQHYPSDKVNQAVQKMKYEYSMLTAGWGFFDDGVTAIANTMRTLDKKIPILLKKRSLSIPLCNVPVFVVANGPSLDDTIEELSEYQEQAIVISCGTAIDSLHRVGIKPDIQVEVERVYSTAYRLQKIKDKDPDYLKGITLMGNSILHPMVYDLFDECYCGLKGGEGFTSIFQHQLDKDGEFAFVSMSNPMAANMGLSVATMLGFTDIYLFGIDCGYISEEKHHSSNSTYYSKDGKDLDTYSQKQKDGLVLKGNFVDRVKTTHLLDLSRRQMEKVIALVRRQRKTLQVYNTSNGVFIEGTTPLPKDMMLIGGHQETKSRAIDFLKNQCFRVPSFSREDFEACMSFDDFEDVCGQLVSHLDKEFESREEFVNAVKEQATVLFALRTPMLEHLFYMIEGSLYTVNSLLFEMAYMYDDEAYCMQVLNEGVKIACEFYAAMPEKYANTYNNLDMFLGDKIKKMYG